MVPLEISDQLDQRETREPLDLPDPKELLDPLVKWESKEQEDRQVVRESQEREEEKEMMPSIVLAPREMERMHPHRRKREEPQDLQLHLIRVVTLLLLLIREELEDTQEDKDMLLPLMERSNPKRLFI